MLGRPKVLRFRDGPMDLAKVLAYLHRELETLDHAISCLERLEQNYPRPEVPPELMEAPGKTARRGRARKPRTKGVKAEGSS